MKRRFVIPLTVAMALHAILLFGFRTPAPPPLPRVLPTPANPPPPPESVMQIVMAPDPDDHPVAPAQGDPVRTRPDVPEPPPPDPATRIVMTPTIPDLNPPNPSTIPSITPIGKRDGVGIGPDGPGPFTSAALDNPPRARSQVAPVYPYEARSKAQNGDVIVEFVVDEAGHVLNPQVLHSSNPLFEAPTLRAVAKWRFEPGRKDGRVVRFRLAVPVKFAVNP